jgi:uncharacterized BrkB/YihY/UPF0761 family membrane protein
MNMMAIFLDGAGLMIGSLLVAAALTFFAWWLAQVLHRPLVAVVLPLAVAAGLLGSPLEDSLFVRMLAVFALVGAAFLWFVRHETAEQCRQSR